MKLLSTVAAAAAFMAISTAASAAITVSNGAYQTYAADVASFSEASVICNFDGPANGSGACTGAPGFTFSLAGGSAPGTGLYTGTASYTAAPPGDGTQYASVLGPNGVATLSFIGTVIPGISFFMGSPDQYNSITFLNNGVAVQTFNGSQFTGPPANGDQSLGERITFNFNGTAVNSIQFTSTENSFEFDRLGLAVPEPTTWAMMLLGFGGIGAMIRRRRQMLATA